MANKIFFKLNICFYLNVCFLLSVQYTVQYQDEMFLSVYYIYFHTTAFSVRLIFISQT